MKGFKVISDPARREHFVYRALTADGQLLYVGCTQNLAGRLRQHRADHKPWLPMVHRWTLQGPYSYQTARTLEHIALRDEYPAYGDTPQRAGGRARQNKWINDRLRELLLPGYSHREFADAIKAAIHESEEIDWAAISDAAMKTTTNTRKAA